MSANQTIYLQTGKVAVEDLNDFIRQLKDNYSESFLYWIEPSAVLPISGEKGPLKDMNCFGKGSPPVLNHPIDEMRIFWNDRMVHIVRLEKEAYQWLKVCETDPLDNEHSDTQTWDRIQSIEAIPKEIHLQSKPALNRFGIKKGIQGKVTCKEYRKDGHLLTWRITGLKLKYDTEAVGE